MQDNPWKVWNQPMNKFEEKMVSSADTNKAEIFADLNSDLLLGVTAAAGVCLLGLKQSVQCHK